MRRIWLFAPLAWGAGVIVYLLALAAWWGQSIQWREVRAVLFWSALAFLLTTALVYTPVLLGLRRLLHGDRPLIIFPIVAMLLGVLPTMLIIAVWGGGFRTLLSPEAALFYAMFLAAGLVLGLGFAWRQE
jgi:hypothetical protein